MTNIPQYFLDCDEASSREAAEAARTIVAAQQEDDLARRGPYDLTEVNLPLTVIDDLDRYASTIRAIDPSRATRAPFDIAHAFVAPFGNGPQLRELIHQIDDEIAWDIPGPLAGTISGELTMLKATIVALESIAAKVQQADMDARIAARAAQQMEGER